MQPIIQIKYLTNSKKNKELAEELLFLFFHANDLLSFGIFRAFFQQNLLNLPRNIKKRLMA